jgi:hypothetical protein
MNPKIDHSNHFYMLIDGDPVATNDIGEWGRWMATNTRAVAKTSIDGADVSTVFLGLDHSFRVGAVPILFETMIFGGAHDQYQERYATLEEAMRGHERAVAIAKGEVEA